MFVILTPKEIGKPQSLFLLGDNTLQTTYIEVRTLNQKRAIVSVIGKDQVGIIAKVTTLLSDQNVNILDISQTILQDFFTMMMLVDVTNFENLEELREQLADLGESLGLTINIQLEEIFQAMHRV